MVRPRWHDLVIVAALVGLLFVGVWALWWDDVRAYLHLAPQRPASGSSPEKSRPEASSSPRT